MTTSEYKKVITGIFRRNTYRGFADWRQCGNLEEELTDFLVKSNNELVEEGRDKDLFEITGRAVSKWNDTSKDDSNGETQFFEVTVGEIWDGIYTREPADISHKKMFDWFMSKMDGSLIDYMEDFLLEYVMAHFPEPELMERKLAFLYQRIKDEIRKAEDHSWRWLMVERYQRMVLQIYSEQKRSMEFIRTYAEKMDSQKSRECLAEIELKYGNTDAAVEIYEELAAKEMGRGGLFHDYNLKLKDIYKENGLQEKYEEQLGKLLILEPGREDILTEYKALVPPEDWEEARDKLFDSFKPDDRRALPWYAMEGCLDRLMDGVEACGYPYLKIYAKILEDKYPERCLSILVKTADEDVAIANQRKDYQHVARVLRWIKKYPSGGVIAAELAAKYRAAYPRRRAMIEELKGF